MYIVDWWRFVGILILDYHIPPKDAWNCTLREYLMISTCKEKKSIRVEKSQDSQEEIEEHFKLMEMRNG